MLPAHGQGFADRIDVLIGVNADVSTITGMYVLDQKETPGLGALITEEPFREQFRGVSTDAPWRSSTPSPPARARSSPSAARRSRPTAWPRSSIGRLGI